MYTSYSERARSRIPASRSITNRQRSPGPAPERASEQLYKKDERASKRAAFQRATAALLSCCRVQQLLDCRGVCVDVVTEACRVSDRWRQEIFQSETVRPTYDQKS